MEENKIIHPGIEDSRVLTYLNLIDQPEYENTEKEDQLLELWREKYYIAQSEYENSRANSKQVKVWRDAYEGKFNALDTEGNITDKRLKAIRKLAFELVEGKINSKIPAPKMSPRHHSDLYPVNTTESLMRHEIDKMLSEEMNDEAEHDVLIDSTVWFKVEWNPFDNTHMRSGNPIVKACPIDTVYPQPGVKDYKKLEYIFEKSCMTVAECLDLYDRYILSPTHNDIIPVVTVYFLNKDRYVGKFSWCEETGQVICNDLEWGIRKRRECSKCHTVVNIADTCPVCGSKDIKYTSVKDERLKNDLLYFSNPYREGVTSDIDEDVNSQDESKTIPAGTVIPYYLIRQLPFVPYRRISVPGTMYGISEVELILEDQDIINKMLNKAEKKSLKSRTYITKLKDTNINDSDDEVSQVEVESPQEGQSIQVKQVVSDISEEITNANILYDTAKSTVGITNTDQGKNDSTAISGKAKQLQMAASAQRNYGPDKLRNLAFSGVYELLFKYLLAFCDEDRTFVTLLPDGTKTEQTWSKYMFLAQDEYGEYYYKDDYAFSVDDATDITQDRASMWQLITNDYINGTMGTAIDPTRALKMYWQMMEQYGYPIAKYALAFMDDATQHLPTDVEKTLVENPEAVQLALSFIKDSQEQAGLTGNGGGQQGGARLGAGRIGNNGTHASNVEKTNNKNRTESGAAQTTTAATALGGMQGGTGMNSAVTDQKAENNTLAGTGQE